MSLTTSALETRLRWAGLGLVGCYAAFVPVSFAIATVTPFGARQAEELSAFATLADAIWLPSSTWRAGVVRVLAGESVLALREARTLVCAMLLAAATACALYASAVVARSTAAVRPSTVRLLLRYCALFALVNVLVYPMFTQDFWLSVVWGRMWRDGVNPYAEYLTAAALAGTPLLDFPIRMTYGPLWAWISAGLAAGSGASVVAAFVVFKLFLAACWLGTVALVRLMLGGAPPATQAAAICFLGWWPLAVHFAVAEGHNDIVLVFLGALWLHAALRERAAAMPLLVSSVLVKYVTAPLVPLELLRAWRVGALRRPAYLLVLFAALTVAWLIVRPLWIGPAFFAPVLDMQGWRFLTPAAALSTLSDWAGLSVPIAVPDALIKLACGAAVLVRARRYWREPSPGRLAELVLLVVASVLFAGVAHVWPWFLLWPLVPAALVGSGWLWRFVAAAAVAGPLLDLFWLYASGWTQVPIAGVAFFTLVVGIWLWPRPWRQLAWGPALPASRPGLEARP